MTFATSRTMTTTSKGFDALSRLTSISTFAAEAATLTSFRYTDKSASQRTGVANADGRWSYTWDAENRLLKVENRAETPQASKRRVEWTYDALGWRGQLIT
jgi:YD repeat-containing protein